MTEILTKLAEHGGPLGIVLVLAWLYIKQLHNELKEVQDKRVEEAQAVTEKLLTLNNSWNETISNQITALDAHQSAYERMQQLLQEVKELLRGGRRGS